MAKTRKNALIEDAFSQFDVVVKRFLDTVPERLQTAEIEPPGGKKPEIRPLPFNPTNSSLGGVETPTPPALRPSLGD